MARRNADLALVYPASKCPCGLKVGFLSSSRTDVNCTQCNGWGYLYGDPVEVLGVACSYQVRRDPVEVASMGPGDLTFSPLPRTKIWIADFDMLRFDRHEDGEVYEGELVIRGQGPSDDVRWTIKRVDSITTVVLPGIKTSYALDTDFTFSGRTITWVSGHGPSAGVPYSARYRATFDWIASQPPYSRYARGTQLGQRVMLRRREMVRSSP